ncbi:MAG: tyrosine-type recombinase/integrase [Caulobacteraceae bacterium]
MSVYKKKKSRLWLYDFVLKGHRFHGSTGQATRAKAERVEIALRESIALEMARTPPGEAFQLKIREIPTLDQAAQEWWEAKGVNLGSPETEKSRETLLAAAVELVGATTLVTAIRTADIAKAMQKRRGRLVRGKKVPANATVNRETIDTIRPVIRRAYKLLDMGSPPIDWGEVRMPEPKPKPRDYSADQVASIYDALPHWWQDFARFEARYGPRVTEMFFTIDDVDLGGSDFKGARLLLRNRKGDDDHYLPLMHDDAAMLAARIGRARAAGISTPWFRELKSGRLKALKRGGALQAMRTAMRKCGLHASRGAKGSHDLRHHAGMQFLRATKNLRATQKLLGHANIQSTLVYAHVMDDDLREGLEALSRNSPEPPVAGEEKVEGKQRAKG